MAERKLRHHNKLHGTSIRPRLSVFRSNRRIYAQAIDDDRGATIFAASSGVESATKPVERAYALGQALAAQAKKKKVQELVFDRGSFRYHGQIKAVAEGIRSAGIKL